jgi:hypothetical protein
MSFSLSQTIVGATEVLPASFSSFGSLSCKVETFVPSDLALRAHKPRCGRPLRGSLRARPRCGLWRPANSIWCSPDIVMEGLPVILAIGFTATPPKPVRISRNASRASVMLVTSLSLARPCAATLSLCAVSFCLMCFCQHCYGLLLRRSPPISGVPEERNRSSVSVMSLDSGDQKSASLGQP